MIRDACCQTHCQFQFQSLARTVSSTSAAYKQRVSSDRRETSRGLRDDDTLPRSYHGMETAHSGAWWQRPKAVRWPKRSSWLLKLSTSYNLQHVVGDRSQCRSSASYTLPVYSVLHTVSLLDYCMRQYAIMVAHSAKDSVCQNIWNWSILLFTIRPSM